MFEKIAINLLVDAQRSEASKRRYHQESKLNELEWESIPDTYATSIQDQVFVNECRSRLSKEDCKLFDEHFIQGESLREIAARRGVSAAAMSKRWVRVIETLLPLLGDEKEDHVEARGESDLLDSLRFVITVRNGKLAAQHNSL